MVVYSRSFYHASMSVAEANTRQLSKEDHLLADRIKELREQTGLSQQKLSQMIGKYDSYIAYIEERRRGLSLTSLYAVAKALKVKVGDLFVF